MTSPGESRRGDGGRHGHEEFAGPLGLVIGLTMLVGRRWSSRLLAEQADLAPGDRVLDVGCGPGSAAREAARRGAVVTGVDPAPVMLSLARLASRRRLGVTFREGAAEAIPLPDGAVTVAWSLASAHHWADIPAGLRELYRVLAPGGRLLVAERLTRPGASGLAGHGFTEARAEEFAAAARSAGFADVTREAVHSGRRPVSVIRARRPPGASA